MSVLWTTRRLWIPFVLAAVCLVATQFSGPVLTVVFMIAAFGFVIDGATLLWSARAG